MQERKLTGASLKKKERIAYSNEYTQQDIPPDKSGMVSSSLFSQVIFL